MRQPQIVYAQSGQPWTREPLSGQALTQELAWRRKIAEAQDAGDIQGEINARRMLVSVQDAAQGPTPVTPDPLERFGHGAAQIAGGIRQLLPEAAGGFTPEEDAEFAEGNRLYAQGRGPGIDTLSLAGEAFTAAPAMLLPQIPARGMLGRAAAGAAGGAAGGGLLYAPNARERAINATLGATGGAAGSTILPPLVRAGVATTRAARRAAGLLDPTANLRATAQLERAAGQEGVDLADIGREAGDALRAQTAQSMSSGGVLTGQPLQRQVQAARFGYTGDAAPTRGQLTRDPAQFGDEQNLFKLDDVGEDLANRFQQQRAQDAMVVEGFQGRYGGPVEPGVAGEAIEEAVQSRAGEWQGRVSQAYDAARAARPGATIEGERVREAFAPLHKDLKNQLRGGVTRRLNELIKQPDGVSPQDLENLDRLLTMQVGKDAPTDRAMRLMKERTRALIDESGEEFGGLYRQAVGEARKRFDAIGDMRKITSRLVRGDVDPIKVIPTIRNAGLREVTALRDFVIDTAPEKWQAVRAGILSEIADQAFPSGNFGQNAYNRALKRYGPERLRVLFGDDGAKDLLDFGNVVRDLYAVPRGSRQSFSNTPIVQANMLNNTMQGILRGVPGVANIVNPLIQNAQQRGQRMVVDMALNPGKGAPLLSPALPPEGTAASLLRTGSGLLGSVPAASTSNDRRQR